MARPKKTRRFSVPAALALIAVLALGFFLVLSHFMSSYRRDTYERFIASNIAALKETTGTLISKTKDGFEHCQYEVRILALGMSRALRSEGFSSVNEIGEDDRAHIGAFVQASGFDYCAVLNDSGKGLYSDGESVRPINMYFSQAYVDCIASPSGEAISFISDPFNAVGADVVAFSCRSGSILLIGIYSLDSFEALYDSTTFGDHASYLITTDTGLILSSAHVKPEVSDSLNLFTYFEKDARNAAFFAADEGGESGYSRALSDFREGRSGSAELYFEGALHELVYAPVPHTDWSFISLVSYDYITADAAEINAMTTRLAFLIITVLLVLFVVACVLLVFVLRARASREAVRRDRIFTLMTHYVPNVIVVADSESGGIEYASRNADKVLGLAEGFQSVVSEAFCRCVREEDRPGVLRLIDDVRTGRRTSDSLTVGFTRPDTHEDVVLSLCGYLIAEEDSRQRFITLTIEDITGDVRARERLEEALENEERANASKSLFLANMSHDIRTPMNAIIGLTTLAMHHPQDQKKVGECLQKIAHSSQLLLGLINDVLDMTKIESGKMQLSETEFELGDWLDGVVTVTQSQTSVRAQRFRVSARGVTHERLFGDTVRLGQVLTNVLGNAVKFTPEGGEIRLHVEEVPTDDPALARFVFTVRDNGIGMSREYVSHIFEMFSREQRANESGAQGTGLGMAITKRIVDMMDGEIRVESEPGKGTAFFIELLLRVSTRTERLLTGRSALVIGEPHSEESCREAVRKLTQIGLDAVGTADYDEAAALASERRAAGNAFTFVFLPYKLLALRPGLTRAALRRDLGEGVRALVGFEPDEREALSRVQDAGFAQTIGLPLFQCALARKLWAMLDEASAAPDGLEGALRGLRILLVEDNRLNLEIASEMLGGLMGAQVDTATDGEEGASRFAMAPPHTYDLILMDLQMPVLGGLEAARRIRASGHPQAADIPIVALTANAFEEDRRAAFEAGMNGFISKPIDYDALLREVGRILRDRRELCVLLAEDNALTREIAVELIGEDGAAVEAVENGRQALERYLASPVGAFDALLLDLHMPVMDGFEAARAVRACGRKDAKTIRIFALTASSGDEVGDEAARAGFDAALTKPVDMKRLRELLGWTGNAGRRRDEG